MSADREQQQPYVSERARELLAAELPAFGYQAGAPAPIAIPRTAALRAIEAALTPPASPTGEYRRGIEDAARVARVAAGNRHGPTTRRAICIEIEAAILALVPADGGEG